jgi:hypothetical protein
MFWRAPPRHDPNLLVRAVRLKEGTKTARCWSVAAQAWGRGTQGEPSNYSSPSAKTPTFQCLKAYHCGRLDRSHSLRKVAEPQPKFTRAYKSWPWLASLCLETRGIADHPHDAREVTDECRVRHTVVPAARATQSEDILTLELLGLR